VDITNNDTKRINVTSEKEEELMGKKLNEEKKIVKLVFDDIKD
jgi:hypothetical protein